MLPIEKCETEILIKNNLASPSIKSTLLFPLTLPWGCTKVQGFSLEQGVILIYGSKNHLDQGKYILQPVGYRLMTTFIIKEDLKNEDRLLEYEHLKQS